MKLINTLLVFLCWVIAQANALPADVTGTTEITAPTGAPSDINSKPEVVFTEPVAVVGTSSCPNCTELEAIAAIAWSDYDTIDYVSGSWYVKVYDSGNFDFQTTFQNLNQAFPLDYDIVCGLRDVAKGQPGNLFTFSRQGDLAAGEIEPTIVSSGNNAYVKSSWGRIVAGGDDLRCSLGQNSNQNAHYDYFTAWIREHFGDITSIIHVYG